MTKVAYASFTKGADAARKYYDEKQYKGWFSPGGPVILVFADLSGSAALPEQLDIEWASKVIIAHNFILYNAFKQIGGKIVKEIGDEVMVRVGIGKKKAEDALKTVLAAVHALKDMERYNRKAGVKYLIKSKVVIYLVTSTIERSRDFEGQDLAVHDLYGQEVNRAARVVRLIAKEGQILVSSRIAALIKNDKASLQILKNKGISISNGHALRGLKNIQGDVVVHEVIYGEQGIGIEERYQEMLVFLDPRPDQATITPRQLMNGVVSWIQENSEYSKDMKYSALLLGDRSLVLRTRAKDLNQHSERLYELMNRTSVGMANSFIIHTQLKGSIRQGGSGREVRFRHGALVLYSFRVNNPDHYRNFLIYLQGLSIQKKRTQVHLFEAGTTFGDYEAYAIVDAETQEALHDFIYSIREQHAMPQAEIKVYPLLALYPILVKHSPRKEVNVGRSP